MSLEERIRTARGAGQITILRPDASGKLVKAESLPPPGTQEFKARKLSRALTIGTTKVADKSLRGKASKTYSQNMKGE